MKKPKKYKQKLRDVEAIQFTGDNLVEIREFCNLVENSSGRVMFKDPNMPSALEVKPSFWIAKNIRGGFAVFNEHFPSMYEEMKDA